MSDIYWVGGTGSQSLATTANYSSGALPANGDNLWFQQGSSTIDSGLSSLSAISLARIYVTAGFSGTIGTNGNSSDALVLGAGTPIVEINAPNCGRFVIDFGSLVFTLIVINTATATDSPLEVVRVRGGSGASKLYVTGGTVGVCTSRPGLSATISEWDVSGSSTNTAQFGGSSGGTLNLGYGVTWTTGNQDGGTVTTSTAGTTLKQLGGNLITYGTGKITTMDLGGSAILDHRPTSGAACDTLSVQTGGVADWSQDPRPFTVTNPVKLYKGSTLSTFNQAQPTWTGGIDLIECGFEEVTLNLGKSLLLTVAAG